MPRVVVEASRRVSGGNHQSSPAGIGMSNMQMSASWYAARRCWRLLLASARGTAAACDFGNRRREARSGAAGGLPVRASSLSSSRGSQSISCRRQSRHPRARIYREAARSVNGAEMSRSWPISYARPRNRASSRRIKGGAPCFNHGTMARLRKR